MTTYRTELEEGKAERLYIMLDQKREDYALLKTGITRDTLKHRFHNYRSLNPMVELVATAEIRQRQHLETVEEMIFDFFRTEKDYDHVFGEWVAITNAEDIKAIRENGFKFFGKLWYRTKNNTYYNTMVYELWECRKR